MSNLTDSAGLLHIFRFGVDSSEFNLGLLFLIAACFIKPSEISSLKLQRCKLLFDAD